MQKKMDMIPDGSPMDKEKENLEVLLIQFTRSLKTKGFSEEESELILSAGTDHYAREQAIDCVYN